MYVNLLKSAIFLLRGTKWVTRAGKVVAFFCSGNQLKHRIPFISPARGASYKKEKYCTHLNVEKVVAIRYLNKWQSIIESKE